MHLTPVVEPPALYTIILQKSARVPAARCYLSRSLAGAQIHCGECRIRWQRESLWDRAEGLVTLGAGDSLAPHAHRHKGGAATCSAVSPRPSCPYRLSPQHRTSPTASAHCAGQTKVRQEHVRRGCLRVRKRATAWLRGRCERPGRSFRFRCVRNCGRRRPHRVKAALRKFARAPTHSVKLCASIAHANAGSQQSGERGTLLEPSHRRDGRDRAAASPPRASCTRGRLRVVEGSGHRLQREGEREEGGRLPPAPPFPPPAPAASESHCPAGDAASCVRRG